MPLKENWDPEQARGNPTKSQQVKELLHRVTALGGKKKKEEVVMGDHQHLQGDGNVAIPMVSGDGPRGLLERMQSQNTEFIHMLGTMGSALRTFR